MRISFFPRGKYHHPEVYHIFLQMSKNPQLSKDIVRHHLSPFVDLKTALTLLQTSKQFAPIAESLPYKQVLSLWNRHREKVERLEIKSTATPRRSLGIDLKVSKLGPPTPEEFRKMGPPTQAALLWKEYLDLLLLYYYNFLFKYYIIMCEWFLSEEIGKMSVERDDVKERIAQLEMSLLPVAIHYLPLRYIPELFEDWYRNASEGLPCQDELPALSDEQFIILVLFLRRVVRELSDKEILESWGTLPETHLSDLSDEKVPLHDRIKKIYSMVMYHDTDEEISPDILALAVIMANRSNLVRKCADVEITQSVLSKARGEYRVHERKITPMLISDDLMYELDLIYSRVGYPLPRRTLNLLAQYLEEPEKNYPHLYPPRSQ